MEWKNRNVESADELVVDARRKFNTHFATFWHLTHLATGCDSDSDVKESWNTINNTGREWKKSMDKDDFFEFDHQLSNELIFMEEKIHKETDTTLDEKSIEILENFDKCLDIATTLSEQMMNDQVSPLSVCITFVTYFGVVLTNFKKLPLLWNHLFVSHIYQLLSLAKVCYPTHQQSVFAPLFDRYAIITAELREHFTSRLTGPTIPTNSTVPTNLTTTLPAAALKLFQPVISLITLIEEVKCIAKQIPAAVTSIVHEYCHLDPFNVDDFEFVKLRSIVPAKDLEIKTLTA